MSLLTRSSVVKMQTFPSRSLTKSFAASQLTFKLINALSQIKRTKVTDYTLEHVRDA